MGELARGSHRPLLDMYQSGRKDDIARRPHCSLQQLQYIQATKVQSSILYTTTLDIKRPARMILYHAEYRSRKADVLFRMCRHSTLYRETCKNDITLTCSHHLTSSSPSLMNFLNPRILRPTIRFIHKPTLTRTFKPQLLRYRPPTLCYATATKMETNNKDLELSNLFDVKGKVALITGGGRSISQFKSSMRWY